MDKSNEPELARLLATQPTLRRGALATSKTRTGLATGHRWLDAALPDSGWPRGCVIELHHRYDGVGELGLLLPSLAALTAANAWVGLVAPPHVPYAPALVAAGVVLSRLLVIDVREAREQLWALEQSLASGACGAVLGWTEKIDYQQLRRLQLAAETGDASCFLFRPLAQVSQSSPAGLRLTVERRNNMLIADVFKSQRGLNRANGRFGSTVCIESESETEQQPRTLGPERSTTASYRVTARGKSLHKVESPPCFG